MSLTVNLRHLEARQIHLKGDLPAEELDFGLRDDVVRAQRPLNYDLTVEKVAHAILVQGSLELALDCQCVRCLKPFLVPVKLESWTLHLPLQGDDKVAVDNDCVDLTPFAREDMLLEFPQHPLCKPDCGGLNNDRGDRHELGLSAWNELDKLNF